MDEALTERVEAFLRDRSRLNQPFTAAQLSAAVAIERFGERDAQLFLVALMGQGRAHQGPDGWHPGPPPAS
jgi:hypothetical protein